MFTPSKHIPKLAALVAALVLVACSDESNTTAPVASTGQVVAAAMPSVAASGAIEARQIERPAGGDLHHVAMATVYPSNAVTYQFTVTPTVSATFILGTHMVSFPLNTICNPATSTYGPSAWLSSCTKLTTPIVITATTWTDAAGRPQIDFANAIRFTPNTSSQLPAIYLRDAAASLNSWGRVDYCSGVGSCVNEAATDAVLATQRDAVTGYLFRLIRHFSGYNVWA